MLYASLFAKLQKHDIKLIRLEKQEYQEKKPKSIASRVGPKDAMIDDGSYQDENVG